MPMAIFYSKWKLTYFQSSVYLKGRVTKGDRNWDRSSIYTGSLHKWLQWLGLGLGQAKARNLQHHPVLRCGWQGLKYLEHLSLFPGVLAGSWIGIRVHRTRTSAPKWDTAITVSCLIHCTQSQLQQIFLWLNLHRNVHTLDSQKVLVKLTQCWK